MFDICSDDESAHPAQDAGNDSDSDYDLDLDSYNPIQSTHTAESPAPVTIISPKLSKVHLNDLQVRVPWFVLGKLFQENIGDTSASNGILLCCPQPEKSGKKATKTLSSLCEQCLRIVVFILFQSVDQISRVVFHTIIFHSAESNSVQISVEPPCQVTCSPLYLPSQLQD